MWFIIQRSADILQVVRAKTIWANKFCLPEPDTCSNQCHMACCPPYSPSSSVCMCSELHEKLQEEAQNSHITDHFIILSLRQHIGTELRTHGEGSSRIWSSAYRRVYGRSAGSALSGLIWHLDHRCWACTQEEGYLEAAAQSVPYTCTQLKGKSVTACHYEAPHIRSLYTYMKGEWKTLRMRHQDTWNLGNCYLQRQSPAAPDPNTLLPRF